MFLKTLLLINYFFFHAVMKYGIIFKGNSYTSIKVFRMQKRVIRIFVGCGSRDFYRNLFKKLNILPSFSQCILSLLIFVVNNSDQFLTNSEICNINTRHSSNIYFPLTNLHVHQRRV
jgi:hypothetical protein